MPRAKPPAITDIPPSNTTHLFASRKSGERHDRGSLLTSERIAQDLARFHSAGCRIEVLGNTRMLTRIDADAGAPAAQTPDANPIR